MLFESYVALISLINTLLIAVVGFMSYRLNSRADDTARREAEILDIVRRELISGTLSDVLDLKLKPVVQRLDELTVKIDEYHKGEDKNE